MSPNLCPAFCIAYFQPKFCICMKKFIPILLGLAGLGLAIYSLTKNWAGWTQSSQYGQGFTFGSIGAEMWQGLAAAWAIVLGFALLFGKPKLAIIPGMIGVGLALLVQFSPPVVQGIQWNPQWGLFFAVAGGALVAVAGIMKPSHV
jgi:hypothetical protein